MRHLKYLFLSLVGLLFATPAWADTISVNFEPTLYNLGSINLQDGWSAFGSAGSGCALYDHAISNSGIAAFGTQSLRISNAVTSGCFGDQTFSKSLLNESGETSAENGGYSGGARQRYFVAEWDFASAVQAEEQPGLAFTVSPDRGDGARMGWVQMTDTPNGLAVNFYDYQKAAGDFVFTNVATDLDRSKVHHVKMTVEFVDGIANDVVQVYVDGILKHTGTSWEDYFRDEEGNSTRTVDSLLFRTGGSSAPATLHKGFFIDNMTLSSGPVPLTNKDQCKKDGWKILANSKGETFKNQGACVSYIEANAKAGKR